MVLNSLKRSRAHMTGSNPISAPVSPSTDGQATLTTLTTLSPPPPPNVHFPSQHTQHTQQPRKHQRLNQSSAVSTHSAHTQPQTQTQTQTPSPTYNPYGYHPSLHSQNQILNQSQAQNQHGQSQSRPVQISPGQPKPYSYPHSIADPQTQPPVLVTNAIPAQIHSNNPLSQSIHGQLSHIQRRPGRSRVSRFDKRASEVSAQTPQTPIPRSGHLLAVTQPMPDRTNLRSQQLGQQQQQQQQSLRLSSQGQGSLLGRSQVPLQQVPGSGVAGMGQHLLNSGVTGGQLRPPVPPITPFAPPQAHLSNLSPHSQQQAQFSVQRSQSGQIHSQTHGPSGQSTGALLQTIGAGQDRMPSQAVTSASQSSQALLQPNKQPWNKPRGGGGGASQVSPQGHQRYGQTTGQTHQQTHQAHCQAQTRGHIAGASGFPPPPPIPPQPPTLPPHVQGAIQGINQGINIQMYGHGAPGAHQSHQSHPQTPGHGTQHSEPLLTRQRTQAHNSHGNQLNRQRQDHLARRLPPHSGPRYHR